MSDIEKRFRDLTEDITEKTERVRGGYQIDMTKVARDVAVLCEEAIKTGAEERQNVKVAMAEMISALDVLEESLKDEKTRLEKLH